MLLRLALSPGVALATIDAMCVLPTSVKDNKLHEASYVPADCLPPAAQPPQLTVFLVSQLQNHVLLPQLMVGLLQVFNVVNGFPQDSRLVHLRGIKTYRKQFV